MHQALPLHRVEVSTCPIIWKIHLTCINWQKWNGDYFTKDSLQNIGLRYQLGHSSGRCPCPEPGPKNFVVFDNSGPHWISIDYCRCSADPLSNWVQLLREKWFPATLTRPQTVFSFDCLATFHELTLQGKTSLYDYYHTLLRLSDNANLNTQIVSFWTFATMVVTDFFSSAEPLPWDSSCFQNVAEFDGSKASWSGPWSSRYWCNE